MLPVTLRQLQFFVEVARRESLAGAARALRLSQPTISEALRDLERAIGHSLFDRGGRRLRLNAAGRAFQADAARLVGDAQAVVRHHSRRERLAIGASVTVGNYILPDVLIAMMREEPTLEISVAIRNTKATVQALLNREIEAALVEGRVAHPDLDVQAWRRDVQVIVAAPSDPLAGAREAGELARARWILREEGSGTREAFDAAAGTWPFAPEVAMTVGGNELLKQAVAAGVGLGCLSLAAVRAELDRGELILVRPRGIVIERTLSLVTPRGARPEPALGRFLEHCRLAA